MDIENLQYPIGPFKAPQRYNQAVVDEAISILKLFPQQLRALVANLPNETLDMPYRPKGWTIRQVVHHLADSHHHSYSRFKWALTEDNPTIKAYQEKDWAELEDAKLTPIAWSLTHIEVIHQKIVQMLEGFGKEEWNRTFVHPQTSHVFTLKELACMYAWHSMHHYMHIKNAL